MGLPHGEWNLGSVTLAPPSGLLLASLGVDGRWPTLHLPLLFLTSLCNGLVPGGVREEEMGPEPGKGEAGKHRGRPREGVDRCEGESLTGDTVYSHGDRSVWRRSR